MADTVDADELLRRIRRARDWALQQEDRLALKTDADTEGSASANAERARAFNAVRTVLDEIIEPGKHAGPE
ncbi:hypothetical protein ABR738_02755 [Streptomyces sp. Edi4]|uniref:hypothetical protein n=1 Tax=Streptomyces sp. Edi4 TaxID=3162527 RepID=UPI00330586FB